MKPKEKAEELYNKFLDYTPVEFEHEYTIKCALIAVDEIISNINTSSLYFSDVMYWRQVKNEIELL